MRRILFAAFGVVAVLFAYAGQQFAAGAPSAPRASAQDPVALLEMGDAAKVLKHTAATEEQLLASLAQADVKQRPLINKVERQEAWIEREADKIDADEHKADQILGGDRNAQTAQTPLPETPPGTEPAQTSTPEQIQEIQQALADATAQQEALLQQGKALAQQEATEIAAHTSAGQPRRIANAGQPLRPRVKPDRRPARHAADGCSRERYESLTHLGAARHHALNMAALVRR